MEAADCTNNKDSEVEEVESNFYETVSEPSLKDKKKICFHVNLRRYSLNCNFLQYLQVVSTIPKRLLKKENLDPKFIFSQDNAFFQLSSTVKVNLLKLKSKDYYWSFINKVNLELKAPK